MANVINRTTKRYLKSVNTPDYPIEDWIINPILPECDPSEWIIEGDLVRETTQSEKDAKIAERLGEEQTKKDKASADKTKRDADKIKARKTFMALSVEEKLVSLYNSLHEV